MKRKLQLKKKVDKSVLFCCTSVVVCAIVIDVLNFNSMINHYTRKTIVSNDGMSAYQLE